MFYDNYVHICEHFGKAPTMVLRDIGISASAYQNWKAGGNPSNSTKKKLADYFGITIDELVSGKIKKPAANEGDELSDDEKQFLNLIRQLPPKERKIVEQLATSLYNTQ